MSFWKKIRKKYAKSVYNVEAIVSEYVYTHEREYNEFIMRLKALDTSIFSELFLLYLNNLPQNAINLLCTLLTMLTSKSKEKVRKHFIVFFKLFENNQGVLFEKFDNGETISWDVISGKISSSYTKKEEASSDVVVSISKKDLVDKFQKLSPETRIYIKNLFIKQALEFSSVNASDDAKKMIRYFAEATVVSLMYYAPQTFKKLQYVIVKERPAIVMFTYRFLVYDKGLKVVSEALTSLYNEHAGLGGLITVRTAIKVFCQFEIENGLSTTIEWEKMIKQPSADDKDDLRLMLLGLLSLLKNKSGNKLIPYKSFEELLSPSYNHAKIKDLIKEFVKHYSSNQKDIAILFFMLWENGFLKDKKLSPISLYRALQHETHFEKDYSGIQRTYRKLMDSANDRNLLDRKLKSRYSTIVEEWLHRFKDCSNSIGNSQES